MARGCHVTGASPVYLPEKVLETFLDRDRVRCFYMYGVFSHDFQTSVSQTFRTKLKTNQSVPLFVSKVRKERLVREAQSLETFPSFEKR